MAATTTARPTKQRSSGTSILYEFDPLAVAASVACNSGAMAAIDTSGNIRPARTSTTDRVLGVFCGEADNADGAAGDIAVRVKRGVYQFANSASTDAIAAKDIGADCYAVDDQTVALTNGTNTRVRAGRIVGVDSGGVWVEFY